MEKMERVELHLHTKLSDNISVIDPKKRWNMLLHILIKQSLLPILIMCRTFLRLQMRIKNVVIRP